MRKMFSLLLITPIALFAQNNESQSLQVDSAQDVEVMISVEKLTALENSKSDLDKRLKAANKRILELQMTIQNDSATIRKDKSCISRLKADSLSIHNTVNRLNEQLLKSDKCLINMASNFLYIPYEAYSVDSIAIRSFESVSDKALKEKHKIRYTLLKNYKKYIESFTAFLIGQRDESKKPFTKNANEAIQSLRSQPFYIAYHEYDDWGSTFLGKKISNVEQQLKMFNGTSHKVNFDIIINELQDCLKTENNL